MSNNASSSSETAVASIIADAASTAPSNAVLRPSVTDPTSISMAVNTIPISATPISNDVNSNTSLNVSAATPASVINNAGEPVYFPPPLSTGDALPPITLSQSDIHMFLSW